MARFAESPDAECQEALRILGDTVDRVQVPPGAVELDGDPSDWSGVMPAAGFARLPLTPRSESHETWPGGVAAVVRQGRLYVMAGVGGAAYFEAPEHGLRISVDCMGGPAWDARFSIARQGGRWSGTWTDPGRSRDEAKPLKGLRGAIGDVAELAIDVREFAAPEKAKPAWTLWAEARRRTSRGVQMFSCRFVPVYNDAALPGVAAEPYVRTFFLLCADADLAGWERTAAAIAATSATMYQCGDADVRRQVRADNAEMLALARALDRWQAESNIGFRLKDYPLEAQLAWASRSLVNRRYFVVGRVPKQELNDRENHFWASTSPRALCALRALALEEGLVDRSIGETAKRIDCWVRKKQIYMLSSYTFEKRLKTTEDPKEQEKLRERIALAKRQREEADVVGQFHGKPVSEFRLSHSESLLGQIRKRGRIVGTCGQHTFFCRDLLRSLGIAPLQFGVEPAVPGMLDHVWAAYFDPRERCWRSYQAGRRDAQPWYFYVSRVPVYYYAATAPQILMGGQYQGPRAMPLVLSRELRGAQIKEMVQRGLPTSAVRQWLLTPGFH